ncbi:MAG: lipoprotein signal peptidase [Muribaculaceae bacterium]|nr:lipoprotein signal peptidase [Muribaculaceae bacterium]
MTLLPKHRLALAAWAVIALVIIIDQAVKIWVKTSFYLGEDLELLPWFHLRFIQNNGMAFGIELGSKLMLTFFRIALVGALVWYITRLIKYARVPLGYMVSVALVTAGAFGNIIDCVFYGEIFTNPFPPQLATFVPWGEGYGGIFQGLVVDMLYFPLFSFEWPQWMPWLGGRTFSFFDPVFNIADSAITVGMALIILFYSKYLGAYKADEKTD